MYITNLLENGESSLGRLLEGNALVILLLQRLLRPLTAATDGLGVKLEIGAAGVHVEQLRSILINSIKNKLLFPKDEELENLTQRKEWPRRKVWTSCQFRHRQSRRRRWRGWTRPEPRTPPASSRRR